MPGPAQHFAAAAYRRAEQRPVQTFEVAAHVAWVPHRQTGSTAAVLPVCYAETVKAEGAWYAEVSRIHVP